MASCRVAKEEVIYLAFCLDVAQGRMNGVTYENRDHSVAKEEVNEQRFILGFILLSQPV